MPISFIGMLYLAILLHNVSFILYTFPYINYIVKKRVLAKPQRSDSQNTLCASERAFGFLIVKKVNFFRINVYFYVTLSLKSGGHDICKGHPPPPHPEKWGIYTPHPPGIYASGHSITIFFFFLGGGGNMLYSGKQRNLAPAPPPPSLAKRNWSRTYAYEHNSLSPSRTNP